MRKYIAVIGALIVGLGMSITASAAVTHQRAWHRNYRDITPKIIREFNRVNPKVQAVARKYHKRMANAKSPDQRLKYRIQMRNQILLTIKRSPLSVYDFNAVLKAAKYNFKIAQEIKH